MKNMQSVEGAINHLESQQNLAVIDSITSSGTECYDPVSGSDALMSAVGDKKGKKKNRRKKRKSKAMNLENGLPDLKTLLNSNDISTEVNNGSQKDKGRKKRRKRKKSKEASSKQRSPSHSPPRQNIILQKLRSYKSTQGKDANECDGKARSSHSQSPNGRKQNRRKENNTFDKYLSAREVTAGLAANILIEGSIRINQKKFMKAYVKSPDNCQDILIEGMRNRNRALEGDEVAVKLNPESEWRVQGSEKQKTGKVVYIFEKVHTRVCVGFLKRMSGQKKNFALFSPRDSRIPRMRIPIAKCPANFVVDPEKYKYVLYLARIEEWESVQFVLGGIIKEVGVSGDLNSETMAILLENDIDFSPYDVQLYQYFPHPPFQIPEEEMKSRADLRNECIFTIDPLTARDLDDAVSCKELDNGNFLVGVHISDVSYFLKEGTPLDEAVARKATSTYLIDSVLHMLPQEMCQLCSLLPGADKLAFSVFWEITPQAEILRHYFTRSVINSCAQLSYQHAQIMLENPDKQWNKDELPRIYGKYAPEDLSRVVNNLNRLAVIMRGKRFGDGALMIDQPKLSFFLESGSGHPLEYSLHVNTESNRLIEEFMLLANMTVAKRLSTDFPDLAFLRCHPAPHPYIMKELQKTMEERGIFIDISSAGALHASMRRYAGDEHVSQARMLVINNLCARIMSRAKYFCAEIKDTEETFWHYALNVPLYTHFTSPIRRYADVMVHRLLCASLGYSPKPDWRPDYVQAVARNCNRQKYQAKRAGEQSTELYLTLYIGLHGPFIEEAVVMDVKDFSFDVIIRSTRMVQRVYTNNLPFPAKVTCRVENKKVTAQDIEWLPTDSVPFRARLIVEMFSIVTVEVSRSPTSLKVEARLLRPPMSGAFSIQKTLCT